MNNDERLERLKNDLSGLYGKLYIYLKDDGFFRNPSLEAKSKILLEEINYLKAEFRLNKEILSTLEKMESELRGWFKKRTSRILRKSTTAKPSRPRRKTKRYYY